MHETPLCTHKAGRVPRACGARGPRPFPGIPLTSSLGGVQASAHSCAGRVSWPPTPVAAAPSADTDPALHPQVYYALYTFKGRGPNELSVSANQRLRILQFEDVTGNREWWLVEARGRQGYVPSSYIRKTEYT